MRVTNDALIRSPERNVTPLGFARMRRSLELQRRASAQKDVTIAVLLHERRELRATIQELRSSLE